MAEPKAPFEQQDVTVEKRELPLETPPMQLEQDHYGAWVYWRDPWLYGPGVEKNGVIPVSISRREDAEAYVNKLYPGSFPEPEVPPVEPPPTR